ncbi:MAG: V-type ATP synthase subunit I [Peptoniphilaceae bacterium]|nr:V-type ATP synthase subunit I [Peptoniphilaceae bacterium]MDY6018795.1 V-type ATP synthase subunit I [Anaerococcus sp.]
MAIVKMNKFNLLSFDYNRSNLLDILQGFNYVHFNDLEVSDQENYIKEVKNSESLAKIDEDISKLAFLKDNIKKYQEDPKKDAKEPMAIENLTIDELNEFASKIEFEKIYDEVKDLVGEREGLVSKNQNLQSHIRDIEVWKDIDLDLKDLYESKRFFLETGMIPKSYYENFNKNLYQSNIKSALLRQISERDSNIYVVVISSKKDQDKYKEFLKENGFSRIRLSQTGSIKENLARSNKEKEENDKKIKELEKQIGSYRKYTKELEIYNSYLLNLRRKEESQEYFLKTKKIDYIEGYLPKDMVDRFKEDLKNALGANKFFLDIKDADKDDINVPIILKNNKLIEPFESVVDTYALPKYNELDPTPLIAPFYAIYTGFMIGDLGYGLLGVLGTLFALKKLQLNKATRKMVKLVLWMAISATVFGAIFGSIFGGIIPMKGLIDTQKDFNTLIVISLIIATIAMFFALGIKAFVLLRDGKILDAIFDVGFWYMAVGGAGAFILTGTGMVGGSKDIAKWIMILGMVGIVLTGGRQAKSIGAKAALGLYDLYGISSWIGDFVSFLRLMALVLSGGFVAYAVNMIVGMVTSSGGIVGFIGGTIIFVIFQLFNMFLSYLSGYVHSLRLVYVEMFNKFYEGGGKKFREMVEDTNFVNIIRGGRNE